MKRKEDKMPEINEPITLAKAAKLIDVPVSTLKYAAASGNLTHRWIERPGMRPYRVTTLRDARRWHGTHTPHIKKL